MSDFRIVQVPRRVSRRRFVAGVAGGGLLLATPLITGTARADQRRTGTGSAPVLVGNEFDLVIDQTAVDFTGRVRLATTINGSIPAPTLHWREGDTVTIRVTNRLREDTSIHWHGILLPFDMDGVPGISFRGIAPGETFVYRFAVVQTGTYWYHSHSGMQEQKGMYGAIVIEPRDGERIRADRDYVVQFSDWTDEDPHRVLGKLKARSDYYNFNQPSAFDFLRDASDGGVSSAFEKRRMWNEMRMNPTDLADVSAYTYTYLTNGTAPANNWTALFQPGDTVRLRLINSGAMTFFDVRIPGLPMTIVQADGQDVHPVTVDEIRIGVAETYDVLVRPADAAYTIFAQSMDRTGYARGTLAPRRGLEATVPPVDPVEWLSMTDMMGDMSTMGHGGGASRTPSTSGMRGASHVGHGGVALDHSRHVASGSASAAKAVHHARTEFGRSVDMRVDLPRTNLDDPGIGLRNNGRRVLTYADLHTIGGALDERDPVREIELHLTGNMERYAWSIDGLAFGQSTPVHFRYGERLRVVHVNDTMMTHPMHLHGMWQELEGADGRFQVRKHVINVQPAQRVSFLVTADALGRWAWHCHLLLHMDAGMFREVVVA